MTTRISYAQRVRTFGVAGNRRNTVTVRTPWGMAAVVHRLIAQPFMDACNEAAATVAWKPRRCDSFAYRPIRNALSLSLHSWGLACDWFVTPPGVAPPGGVWTPQNAVTPAFARCFERRGFYWGARFTRRDVPHIEWPGGLPSAASPAPPLATEEAEMKIVKEADSDRMWAIGDGVARHLDGPTLAEYRKAWPTVAEPMGRAAIESHAKLGYFP